MKMGDSIDKWMKGISEMKLNSEKPKNTIFMAIVSGHIFLDEKGHEDIEILTQVDNDEKGTDVFCDITNAILDEIDIGGSKDYYFMAIVEAEFIKHEHWEGVEYDVEYGVTEIKSVDDISLK